MKARRWCCYLIERRAAWVLALGILGMIGFIASCALVAARWIGETGFVTMGTLALASFSSSVLVGHLGDPRADRTSTRTIRSKVRHA